MRVAAMESHISNPLKSGTLSFQAVRPKPSERRFKLGTAILLVSCLFAALGIRLYGQIKYIEQGYELEQLRADIVKQDAYLRQLQVNYSYNTRSSHLSKRAKTELSMLQLRPENIRRISASGGDL